MTRTATASERLGTTQFFRLLPSAGRSMGFDLGRMCAVCAREDRKLKHAGGKSATV